MSERDWKLLQMRRSCNLLTRPEMETGGKTPTTPTVSSIIAGVQCQEAVKLLHGMPTIAGGAFVFNGVTCDSYLTTFQRKDDCYSHDTLDEVIALDEGVETITPRNLLSRAKDLLGPKAELELAREVLEKLVCPNCRAEEQIFASLGKVSGDKAWCPSCDGVRREVVTFHKIRGGEPFIDRPLGSVGVPPFDIVIARNNERSIGFELGGDAAAVLGDLLSSDEALELV
jgi:adenylyltransferase/sulfurtransferase